MVVNDKNLHATIAPEVCAYVYSNCITGTLKCVQYSCCMQGLHLTADLTDCQCHPHWLTDASRLGSACEAAVCAVGLTVVGKLLHTFAPLGGGPGGVTATLLLAESHVCVHTWPERNQVTLDVYVCNVGADHSHRARELLARLLALFEPRHCSQHALRRGQAELTEAA